MRYYNQFISFINRIKEANKRINILHASFEIGILIKGIDGLLEIICGFILLFISQTRLNNIIIILTQEEISEDPRYRYYCKFFIEDKCTILRKYTTFC